ncbi:MAG: hypothetical protein EA344_08220 [Alkalicoccus sp.]|nr:MAG: hypothetical protein EA344_08220 [Alkalicoccus sp.]
MFGNSCPESTYEIDSYILFSRQPGFKEHRSFRNNVFKKPQEFSDWSIFIWKELLHKKTGGSKLPSVKGVE